ncbi:ATP synthase F0 subunit B [Geopsychrobacter electrodiphilus]|uniref:ATP synthase F0 subunit B n=1 Tax=Geopsychrobacter electrodiphilus TaxID=225196 RepID=UPI00036AC31A|nr:ATP synthase F0 subunit B [Geopsychrobacter electrodiphilus]
MISLDWTLILQFFNFIILLIILNKILYRPLLGIMAQRREKIVGSKSRARDLEAGIEEKMKQYQEQLNAAKSAAVSERAELRKTAHIQEAEITGEAQNKAVARITSIREQVENEATQAGQILKSEAKAMAGQIASKVLGRALV